MTKAGSTSLTAALLLCAIAGAVPAQNAAGSSSAPSASNVFASSDGYSVWCPPGWLIASKDQDEAVREKAQSYLDKMGNFDLNRFSVMVFNPNDTDYYDNMNVVLTSGSLELNDKSAAMLRAVIPKIGEAMGSEPKNIRIVSRTYAGRQTLVATYGMALYGKDLYLTQVAIPDGDQTMTVTCSCISARAVDDDPNFTAMIDSICTSIHPVSSPSLPLWVTGSIAGGIVGLIVAIVVGSLLRASRSYEQPYSGPQDPQVRPPYQ